MATVRDVAIDALTELGVLAAGETIPADEAAAVLRAVNRMVDQMAAERLAIYTVTRNTWTITASNLTPYTVGTGGTINIARPVYVEAVCFVDTSLPKPVEFPPLVQYTDDEWQRVSIKALTSTYPRACYYNPTFPLGTLNLWPIPTVATLQGILYAPQAVTEFASLDTTVSLPPGYRRMLVKNLAMEMAPSYEKQPHPLLVQQASESKATVKRSNVRPSEIQFGADVRQVGHGQYSAYSIRTG